MNELNTTRNHTIYLSENSRQYDNFPVFCWFVSMSLLLALNKLQVLLYRSFLFFSIMTPDQHRCLGVYILIFLQAFSLRTNKNEMKLTQFNVSTIFHQLRPNNGLSNLYFGRRNCADALKFVCSF